MPRRTRRPKATSRVTQIVQERRADQAVEEALAQDRIKRILEPPPATGPEPVERRRAMSHYKRTRLPACLRQPAKPKITA